MSAENDLKKAQEALKDPNFRGTYEFEGNKYSLTELRDDLIPLLKKRDKAEKKRAKETAGGYAALTSQIRSAQERLQESRDMLTRNRNAFAKNNLSIEELVASEQRVADAENVLAQLTTRAAYPTNVSIPTQATGFTEEQIATMRANADKFGPQLSMIPTEKTTENGTTPSRAATTVVTRSQVDAALVASGLPDTPENRKSIRADLKAGKETVGDWLTVFKRKFPQYQYLLDEKTFGADVTALLQRAVTQKWYESDQFETLMDQGFSGTQYFQNTTTAQQNFDKSTAANKQSQIDQFKLLVQQSFGNLQFDDATLTTIATKAARDNRQGKALELYVYQESFAKPAGTTSFAQPTAATRALTSSAADAVRQIGRDYGSKVTDQEVQDVLTGKTTIDDLRQTYKIAARRWYKGAADDIDAGVTVEQLFRPYKQYAAAILGKPLEQIDLVDANGKPTLYAEALEGQDGPMSISQWTQKLKSDDRFGWQYTPEAKQRATSLVMDLEKAFGFRA